ncbi:MAG: AraC family transcriptional regulator [Clostridia bacterium]|nr:AraC family transcriptional regulator [Clostridia bacterium]
MFEELLDELAQATETAVHWFTPMEGVRVCSFDCMFPGEIRAANLQPKHFETLLCQSGKLSICWNDGSSTQLCSGESLLLSDPSEIHKLCWAERNMCGILVAVDGIHARNSLQQLCTLLGSAPLDMTQLKHALSEQRGCAILFRIPQIEALLHSFLALSIEQRRQYAALLAVELLCHMCCTKHLTCKLPETYYDRHQLQRVEQIHTYLITHLDETITIDQLAKQFQISATVLKQCFRQLYGQPIRKYLQRCRMQRAVELLTTTQLSVLQIANAVGYESTSQFGTVFKRFHQMTPSQYRLKMSNSVDPRPNPYVTAANDVV